MGSKATTTTLKNGETVWEFTISDAMKESVLYEGQVQYADRMEYVEDVSDWMSKHAWRSVIRVAYENVRGKGGIINKARCGDFIIPSGKELVYTKLNKNDPEDIEIHQIINVQVEENREIEDTNLQYVFSLFVKEYENERYKNVGIKEFVRFVWNHCENVLGREVDITVYSKFDYQSNRKNGLARKEEKSRGLNYHFGDEQNRGRNSSESESSEVSYADKELDSRTLLTNALDSIAQTDAEREMLKDYREHIDIIGIKESELVEINKQITTHFYIVYADRNNKLISKNFR